MGLFVDMLGTLLTTFRIGKAGLAGNKTISWGSAAVALPNEPGIRWNEATGKNQYSNDGLVWNNMEPAGAVSVYEAEVDFGTFSGVKTFTVTDANVLTTSKIIVTQSGKAATSRLADENEMDPILFSATPGTGQFTLIAHPLEGPVGGKFKVNYVVG